METAIAHNLAQIQSRINKACAKAGRSISEVQLCLATKTVSAAHIREAIELGVPLIAENKVQEVKSKYTELSNIAHTTHLIGHLQTNKVKDALDFVDCIQSVDRLSLVEKLDQRLQFLGKKCDILLQFNTSFEISKFGMDPKLALSFVKQVARYDTLHIKGLMTIGLFSSDNEQVRKCFKLLVDLQKQINELGLTNVDMGILSMGMSNDLEIAIEEGSTMVRVGTAIFGQRQYPESYY